MAFSALLNDSYISPSFNPNYAKLDNYQVYSMVLFDQMATAETTLGYQNGVYKAERNIFLPTFDGSPPVYVATVPDAISIDSYPGTYTYESAPARTILATQAIAFQSFSPLGKITLDFAAIAKAHPPINPAYTVSHYYTYLPNNPNPIEHTESNGAAPQPNVTHLINGWPYDPRVKPENLKVMATSSRRVTYGYYRRNPYESHPNLLACLDWHQRTIDVTEGKHYILPIVDPVLGSLVVDTATRAEIMQVDLGVTHYPTAALFSDYLPTLFTYWGTLHPPAPSPSSRSHWSDYWVQFHLTSYEAQTYLYLTHSGGPVGYRDTATLLSLGATPYSAIPDAIFKDVSGGATTPIARVIGATNDQWGFGTVTASDNPPPANHPIFNVDEQYFFEAVQPDGSLGAYMVDSPRIMEIHAALDAAKFAVNDLDSSRPRVTNLGYWIEKCGNLLGHRPNADGKIDHAVEKSKYARQRIARPSWEDSQYSLNQFGSRGLVIPHLPNTYTGSGKLAKLYDVVYDIPQLLQALHDQVDIAQGIQHASQIRVKHTDGSIQSFPDLLSVQLETLKIAASMRESVARNQISAAVTGAEVRELFAAIGAPTAQKYLTFKDPTAGKVNQVPYFGHQQGKESITAGISTLKINMAIALGVLMPKAQPAKNKLNPFQVLKKKA